jgi:UrcA family protein
MEVDMNKSIIRALFVASALAGAVHVSAQPPAFVEGRPTVRVAYGDLDLTRPAGQAALDRRIRRAASLVCPPEARGISSLRTHRRCVSAAMADARLHADQAIALAGSLQFAGRPSLPVIGR